jgi:transcription antitermination protein NusB
MGARTSGREAALQMLFAVDAAGHDATGDAEGRPYADETLRGVLARRDELDAMIKATSSKWRLERMNPVDRNILRLGAYELLQRHDIPVAVIIDEGVELAKRYGAEGSPKFVNGLLDELARMHRPES